MACRYFMIAIHEGHPNFDAQNPMVWCGHSDELGGHVWKGGADGRLTGIRFSRLEDAVNSGVAGPNYEIGDKQWECSKLPDRGIVILRYEDVSK